MWSRVPVALLVLAAVIVLATSVVVAPAPTSGNSGDGNFHAVSIAGGFFHNCALVAGGSAECWGDNAFGELGNATLGAARSAPAQVCDGASLGPACTPLTGLVQVATSSSSLGHSCAVTNAGDVKCWGSNAYGQLGDGTIQDSTAPVDVQGLTEPVQAVAVGGEHTCALTEELTPGAGGAVFCWGGNFSGQLGIGSIDSNRYTAPQAVIGLSSGIIQLSAGYDSVCAVTTSSDVKCWGLNTAGEVGDGTITPRPSPTDVCQVYNQLTQSCDSLLTNITSVSVSGYKAFRPHVCAITTSANLKCWGRNSLGQLGIGTADGSPHPLPLDVNGVSGVTAVTTGTFHTCAATTSGVRCWGRNDYGMLGTGDLLIRTSPADVCADETCTGPLTGAVELGSGYYHTCALLSGGDVKCWGSNANGQLGDGTTCCTEPDQQHYQDVPIDSQVDSDHDGCRDNTESLTAPNSQLMGGLRDPKDPWDYFNPTGDGINRIDDILAVVGQYFADKYLDPPFNTILNPAYREATDRTLGSEMWRSGPPNGMERIDDILAVVYQYFNDCQGLH